MDPEGPTDELQRVGTVGDRAVYRHETDGTYHAWIARDSVRESTTYVLVGTVAVALGRDPGQLEPVTTTIDPEALTDLVAHWLAVPHTDDPRELSFRFLDCSVTVTGRGQCVVDPRIERPQST